MIITDQTILEAANAHVGHPEEIDEEVMVTAQRSSFIWGARWAIKYIADNTYKDFDNFNFD